MENITSGGLFPLGTPKLNMFSLKKLNGTLGENNLHMFLLTEGLHNPDNEYNVNVKKRVKLKVRNNYE